MMAACRAPVKPNAYLPARQSSEVRAHSEPRTMEGYWQPGEPSVLWAQAQATLLFSLLLLDDRGIHLSMHILRKSLLISRCSSSDCSSCKHTYLVW